MFDVYLIARSGGGSAGPTVVCFVELDPGPGPLEPRRPDLSVADGGLPQPQAAGINGCVVDPLIYGSTFRGKPRFPENDLQLVGSPHGCV